MSVSACTYNSVHSRVLMHACVCIRVCVCVCVRVCVRFWHTWYTYADASIDVSTCLFYTVWTNAVRGAGGRDSRFVQLQAALCQDAGALTPARALRGAARAAAHLLQVRVALARSC